VGIGVVRAALIVAAMWAFFHALPAAGGQPHADARAYGRELVAQYQLPAEAVARYATATAEQDGTRRAVAAEDASAWVGPSQQVGSGRNPYTLVLTVSGAARAAGEVRSQWQAGWEVRESPVATREVMLPLAGRTGTGVAAGAPVTITAASTAVSFRNERLASPMLNLVAAHNIDISDVHLQVWSGSAPLALPGAALPRRTLLPIGALCLLAWWTLRRPPRRAAPVAGARAVAPLPPPSSLPAFDVSTRSGHEAYDAPLPPPAPALPPVPPPMPRPAPKVNASARVMAALHDVLHAGLSVPTELDTGVRRRKPRR
jgi:hypothetical protein